MTLALAIFLLQPAAPTTCSDHEVSELYEAKEYAQAEKLATRCAAKDPQFYLLAAQAQKRQGKYKAECKSLRAYLKAGVGGSSRTEAEEMLAECASKERTARDKAARNKAPQDKAAGKTGKEGDAGEAGDRATPEEKVTAPPVEGITPPVEDKAVVPPVPEGITPPVDDKAIVPPPPEDEDPPPPDRRRKRLWLGIGIAAGTSALASVTTGLSGYYEYTRNARTTNDGYLKVNNLEPGLHPEQCSGMQCDDIAYLEKTYYPSNKYYKELRNGLQLESAATALGAASLGLVVGTLPELIHKQGGRRIGLGAMIVAGAAMLVGGAVWTSVARQDVGARLAGYHPDDDTSYWRAGADYDAVRRKHLLATALTGLGVGLVVGGSASAVVRWQDKPGASDRRASLRVSPTFGGLMLTGRF